MGYLLGFAMSFLLLMMSMYAFSEVEDQSSEAANEALFRDVAGRVAASVIEMTEIARDRVEAQTVASDSYLVTKSLPIPRDVRGVVYRITLAEKTVTVADVNGRYSETASTLNFAIDGNAACALTSYVICLVEGTTSSDAGRVLVRYEYVKNGGPSATCEVNAGAHRNCVSIS